MHTTILVTGATGAVGSQLVAQLAQQPSIQVRAAGRGPKLQRLNGANVSRVNVDYSDRASLRAALTGVDKVFLLTPIVREQVAIGKMIVDEAKRARVQHLVKLSGLGADRTGGIQLARWHREVETSIEASGMAYTMLRPNSFFENFIRFHGPQPVFNFYLPFVKESVCFVGSADLAEAAAKVLTSDEHQGRAYELTGPEAITVAHVARVLSELSGRAIGYVDVPEEAAREAMLEHGMPVWLANAMTELNALNKSGHAAVVDPRLAELLGRPATSFQAFAERNVQAWRS